MRRRKSGTYTRFSRHRKGRMRSNRVKGEDKREDKREEKDNERRVRKQLYFMSTTVKNLSCYVFLMFFFSLTSNAWSTLSLQVSHKRRHWIPRVQWQVFIVYFSGLIYLTLLVSVLFPSSGFRLTSEKETSTSWWRYCCAADSRGEIRDDNGDDNTDYDSRSLTTILSLCSLFLTWRTHTPLMIATLTLREQIMQKHHYLLSFRWIRKRRRTIAKNQT